MRGSPLALLGLLASLAAAQQPDTLPGLDREYAAAQKTYEAAYMKARRARLPRNEWPQHPAVAFWPRYEALAQAAGKESNEAGEALAWMLGNVSRVEDDHDKAASRGEALIERLFADHLAQPCMLLPARMLARPPRPGPEDPDPGARYVKRLDALLAANQNVAVRAQTLFSKASCLAGRYATPGPKEVAEAHACLEELMKSHPEDPLAARAKPFLFEVDHLQVGMQAPDFETKDVDGVSFKLSDYRGKVLVLDFWGFW